MHFSSHPANTRYGFRPALITKMTRKEPDKNEARIRWGFFFFFFPFLFRPEIFNPFLESMWNVIALLTSISLSQVWGRATLVDYCRNERHSDLVDQTPCSFQCCPLSWRQAPPGEPSGGQPARKGFISRSSDMAKRLWQQRYHQREGQQYIKILLAHSVKSSQAVCTSEHLANVVPCHLSWLKTW